MFLETKDLVKKFDGVRAVDGLSIKIEPGKITSIIGPNGSGKSTLVNALTGIIEIDGGMIYVRTSDVLTGTSDVKKLTKIIPHQVPLLGITRTFQDVRLFEQMTVLDNILVVLTERSVFGSLFVRPKSDSDSGRRKAKEVLEKVSLWEKRNQLAFNLSYGQRKLLEIARVLAMDSNIILLDEPFAGLFPEMVKVVVSTIQHLKSSGKTIILIEHNMDLIRELSDYIFVMDSGKLLAEGLPNEVLTKRTVIEAYLGE